MTDIPGKVTPHTELIKEIMDCRVPKYEREHAACVEIDHLKKEVEAHKTGVTGKWIVKAKRLARELKETEDTLSELITEHALVVAECDKYREGLELLQSTFEQIHGVDAIAKMAKKIVGRCKEILK